MEGSTTIKIITSDGQKFELPREIIDSAESDFMKQLGDEPDEEVTIKEEECKLWCFEKILEFFNKYKTLPIPTQDYPLKSESLEEHGLSGDLKWYADFVESLEFRKLYELYITANYFMFKPLVELCAMAIAAHWRKAEKVNGIQGIRDLLGIEHGFTEEELNAKMPDED